jgi:Ser/Thr protein kinase RdoA (MazF antagonist)
MLVSGDRSAMAQQLNTLLDGYEQFSDFDDRERRLIEPLRTLRMLRHSAWLAARWSDPTFPLNFPFFGTAAYWSQQTTQLREQLEAMQDAADAAPF